MYKIKILFLVFKSYRKKILEIIFFEFFYSLKYFFNGNKYKIHNDSFKTDTIPCPYFFIHKISQFINENKIPNLADLGCGYGRITNFLSDTTYTSIQGYEIDKDVFDEALKNKKKNITIKCENILNINYNDLNTECFIMNDPLKKKNDLENLVKKIHLSKHNLSKKYYLITINIEDDKNYIFEKYKLIKTISAGPTKNVKFYCN